jgi:hypothetical protein
MELVNRMGVGGERASECVSECELVMFTTLH